MMQPNLFFDPSWLLPFARHKIVIRKPKTKQITGSLAPREVSAEKIDQKQTASRSKRT